MLQLALVLLGVARATPVEVTFCVTADIELSGLGGGAGDFWTSNANDKPLPGAFLQVYEAGQNPVATYEFNDYTDPSTGCTGILWLDDATDYVVKGESRAEVEDSIVLTVMNNTVADAVYVSWFYPEAAPYNPPSMSPVQVTLVAGPGIAADTLAVATNAVNRWHGALSNEQIDFYVQQPFADTHYLDNQVIANNEDHKWVLAHEIGHVIAEMRDEGLPPLKDYDEPVDNCYTNIPAGTSHEMGSKEWQSTAAMEGFANFYSSTIWNNITQSNCDFVYWAPIDWDLDGTDDESSNSSFPCFGDPCVAGECASPSFMNDEDWLGDLVSAADTQGCAGTLTNRASEYDVMRMYWGIMINQGVSVGQCLNLYDDANPSTWDPDDPDATLDSDDPPKRFEAASIGLDLLFEWSVEATLQGAYR